MSEEWRDVTKYNDDHAYESHQWSAKPLWIERRFGAPDKWVAVFWRGSKQQIIPMDVSSMEEAQAVSVALWRMS